MRFGISFATVKQKPILEFPWVSKNSIANAESFYSTLFFFFPFNLCAFLFCLFSHTLLSHLFPLHPSSPPSFPFLLPLLPSSSSINSITHPHTVQVLRGRPPRTHRRPPRRARQRTRGRGQRWQSTVLGHARRTHESRRRTDRCVECVCVSMGCL